MISKYLYLMKLQKWTALFVLPVQDKQFRWFILFQNDELNTLSDDFEKLNFNTLKHCIPTR